MRQSSYAAAKVAQYTRRSTVENTSSRPAAVAGDGRRLRRAARRARRHERGRRHHRHSEEQRRLASAEGELGQLLEGPERLAAAGPTSRPARSRPGRQAPQAPQARPARRARQAPAGAAGVAAPGYVAEVLTQTQHERDRRRPSTSFDSSTTAPLNVTVPANETDKLVVSFSARPRATAAPRSAAACVRITRRRHRARPGGRQRRVLRQQRAGRRGRCRPRRIERLSDSQHAIVRVSGDARRPARTR